MTTSMLPDASPAIISLDSLGVLNLESPAIRTGNPA